MELSGLDLSIPQRYSKNYQQEMGEFWAKIRYMLRTSLHSHSPSMDPNHVHYIVEEKIASLNYLYNFNPHGLDQNLA